MVFATLAVPGAAEAAVTSFPNSAFITLADNAVASPYPSAVTSAGLCGTVTAVRVTLTGLNHPASRDVDVMLISPGNRKVMLVSDAGANTSNQTLTFDDAAASQVSQTSLTTGVWRPHNYADVAGTGNDAFTGVPAGTVTDTLASFAGESPNGTWRLFARDDHAGTAGSIGAGWILRLLTPDCPGAPVGPGDPFFDDGEGGLDPEEDGGGGLPGTGTRPRRPAALAHQAEARQRLASRPRRPAARRSRSRSRAPGSVKFTVERRAKGRQSGQEDAWRRSAPTAGRSAASGGSRSAARSPSPAARDRTPSPSGARSAASAWPPGAIA